MKVITFHETSDSTDNEVTWGVGFKFNDSKKSYYYKNDAMPFRCVEETLAELVDRLIAEKSIDQILVSGRRIIEDGCDCDYFNYIICREDCKDVDDSGCEVYTVDGYCDELTEFIIEDFKKNANVEEII